MTGMNRLAVMVRSLSDDELARLERLLTAADKTQRIDLHTIIAEMRANPVQTPQPARSPRQGPAARSAHEASGGRRYELSLYAPSDLDNCAGLFGTELDDRYQSELARVEALAAGGMTYAEAWDRIRTAQPTTLI